MKLTVPAIALALAACRQEAAPAEAEPAGAVGDLAGLYRSGNSDSLCVKADGRAGFINYAPGSEKTNCTVRGQLQNGAIVPDGDTACRIPVEGRGNRLLLGKGGGACAYYCGPNASFAGREFDRQQGSGEAVDLVGDPLC